MIAFDSKLWFESRICTYLSHGLFLFVTSTQFYFEQFIILLFSEFNQKFKIDFSGKCSCFLINLFEVLTFLIIFTQFCTCLIGSSLQLNNFRFIKNCCLKISRAFMFNLKSTFIYCFLKQFLSN
jgi:hypothetical protein